MPNEELTILREILQDHFVPEEEFNSVEFDAVFGRYSAAELAGELLKRVKAAEKAGGRKPDAYLVPHLLSLDGARTSCPSNLIPELEGTVAWGAEVFSDGEGVTDKHGVEHKPIPLFRPVAVGADSPLTDKRAAEILVQMREHMIAWSEVQGEDHEILDIEQSDEKGYAAMAGECLRFLAPLLAQPTAVMAGSQRREIFAICDAYESGIGHGLQLDGHKSGTIFGNPECGKAYEIGYELGEERARAGNADRQSV